MPDARELRQKLARMGEALRRPMEEAVGHGEAVLSCARRGMLLRQSERVLREPGLMTEFRWDSERERCWLELSHGGGSG